MDWVGANINWLGGAWLGVGERKTKFLPQGAQRLHRGSQGHRNHADTDHPWRKLRAILWWVVSAHLNVHGLYMPRACLLCMLTSNRRWLPVKFIT